MTSRQPRSSLTIESLLVPLLTRPRIAQFIKWSVYLALVVNFAIYARDDWLAYQSALANDAPWSDIFEQFSTTIDTLAWLGLVFLFELETYALPDEAYEVWVTRTMHAVRAACYIGIAYAAYGYTATTLDNYDVVELDGMTELCQIADQGTWLQIDAISFVPITTDSCAAISAGAPYYRISNNVSVIDRATLDHVQKLGWIDVSNAFVWLIVVILLEIEVRMQAADRFESRLLTLIRHVNTAFYCVLIINGFVWAATGYPMYAWDAFLWIFGFWAIELNLVGWEQQRVRELAGARAGFSEP